MTAATLPLLLTAYDTEARGIHLLRSEGEHSGASMVDAAHASSAAPTYFEPVRLDGASLIDGGVFAINPSLVAYAEVGGTLDLLLSLGTGSHTRPLPYDKIKDWGQLEWARPLIDVVFDGGQDAVDLQLDALLSDALRPPPDPSSRRPATTSTTPASDNLARLAEEAEDADRGRDRHDRRRLRAPHGVALAHARPGASAIPHASQLSAVSHRSLLGRSSDTWLSAAARIATTCPGSRVRRRHVIRSTR